MSPAVSYALHTDEALLARLAAGDAGGPLEELYGRYERRLYGLGRRLLNDDGMAQELVQETFVRLWRSAKRFDGSKGKASTFVFTIARNLAIDLYRRPSSRQLDPELSEHDHRAVPPGPEEVERVLVGLTVREAMDQLSPAQRQVLELVYGEGRRAAEVSEQLGIPVATVRTRAFYALRALETALGRIGFDPAWAMV